MNDNNLVQKAQLQEHPLQSSIPILGGFIAAIRNLWGTVAAKWMIRQVVQQQNEFNLLAADHLQSLNRRLVDQDKQIVSLTRQVAELNVTIHQLQKQLKQQSETK